MEDRHGVLDCFFICRDQYNEILMREYCAQFERDLENDNYTPITAKDEKEFRAVVSQFPFYKRGMDQVSNGLNLIGKC